MTGTRVSTTVTVTLPRSASVKVTPLIPVRISIRRGFRPSIHTKPGFASSAASGMTCRSRIQRVLREHFCVYQRRLNEHGDAFREPRLGVHRQGVPADQQVSGSR
jgi:hypothetical protein